MLVLHHINGATCSHTKTQLVRVVRSVLGRLKPGGHLLVVEPVIRPALRHIQRALFPFIRTSLALAGVPMIQFHGVDELRVLLSPHTGTRLADLPRPASVTLLAGPEGGFTEVEADFAQQRGFVALQLGPRVLRTETAALAALAAMNVLWGDF